MLEFWDALRRALIRGQQTGCPQTRQDTSSLHNPFPHSLLRTRQVSVTGVRGVKGLGFTGNPIKLETQ